LVSPRNDRFARVVLTFFAGLFDETDNCTCQMRACSMPTTTTTSTTLPTTQQHPSLHGDTSSQRQPEHINISSGTNNRTTIGANQTLQESNSSAITMPAAQSPDTTTLH
jgi:hypothetical protein